ncbi:MAG: hypothetical protein ABUT20_25205 [Bacteroidota bacterium]
MRKLLLSISAAFIIIISVQTPVQAQQYKLKQSTGMMGMKSESTIYVKGMRKRTENPGIMGMGKTVTIEQCDSQRTIKLNDAKKLYFIEPFAQGNDEVIDEDAPKAKTVPSKPIKKDTAVIKGGTITQWYSVIDTGERKQMYGFTARHVWTSRKTKPSPDACYMKDSMLIKTDGWYIDLPKFNCPIHYRPVRPPRRENEPEKPQCTDKFITHKTGKGKLGFPLIETTTMIMGGNMNMETSIETVEFSTATLDSMLFEIPPGYTEVKSEEELHEKMGMKEMMQNAKKEMNENTGPGMFTSEQKKPGMIRIGVYAPTGDEQVQAGLLQKRMVGSLTSNKVEAISITTEDDARKYNCDYTLNAVFSKIKSAGKLGGMLKAIKSGDLSGSYNIQAGLTLKTLSDGSVKTEQKVDGKYDGKVDDAAGNALDEGCRDVLKALK